MTELSFAPGGEKTLPLHAVAKPDLDDWLAGQPNEVARWAKVAGFKAGVGEVLLLPGTDSALSGAVAGLGGEKDAARGRFALAACRASLPEAVFQLETTLDGDDLAEAALGWLLAGYRFDRYASAPAPKAQMVAPKGVDATRLEAIAAGEVLTRDLINTPASDMGPPDLEAAARNLAKQFAAEISSVVGEDLLSRNLPMIHAVGRAADREPRLLDMRWGEAGPRLTLVGKGICFDTGGLNLKPGASMGLMKKDMGGSAAVLGLAQMIMALKLPLRLRVLVPVAENSVSGASFRPQDILTSRKGLTVEINNTDAEGRLVLADALALADEEDTDLIVSMATLTGAARVAVGPDIAPFFSTSDSAADTLWHASRRVRDPVWRLPFWDAYEPMIEPGIADLDNAPKGGFAGTITAALFLRRFVEAAPTYMHFDIYGWQPSAAPGRPKGGVGQGTRALLDALPELLRL
ncbi:MAG: leucyl aminopeptidase family protein [Alphaproteobacteria bacterium]|nr:leucyl aminopeptidase family protein [Alphaproteobacteria bacterium]